MSVKPVPDGYWVVPGRFLAGSYPIAAHGDEATSRLRLDTLLEAGLDTFFDLTREGELPSYLPILNDEAARHNTSVDYRRLSIQDKGLPSNKQMTILLNAIDATLASGRKVYLHCWGGIGRTGTAVGCWFVRHGLTGEAALARLDELYQTTEQSNLFPRSPETDAQIAFILNWKEPSPLSPLLAKHPRRGQGEGPRGEG